MSILSQKSILYVLYITFLAYILAIFFPAVFFGIKGGYDVIHHLSWYLSFRDEIRLDNIYPRWLSTQYNGLGAPVLYFYPPFTNYFFYIVDSLTFFSLKLDHLIAVSAFLLCILSGGAFYLWARTYVPWHMSVLFSFIYMLLPYHLLINFYWRAAIAEFAAYFWMPLIFLAIYNVLQSSQVRWILLLSFSIAGLFFTHLLSALIVGPVAAIYAFLIIKNKYGLNTSRGLQQAIKLGFYAALGIGLTAIYLLPALSLMDHISADALYRKAIEDSYIYKVLFEEIHNYEARIRTSSIAVVYLIIGLYFLYEWLQSKTKSVIKNQHLLGFWVSVVLGAFIFMCGFGSFLFQDPSPYKNIQFLTRLLFITEFAVVTAFMAAVASNTSNSFANKSCLLVIGGLLSLLMLFQLYDVADRSRGIVQKASLSEWRQVEMRMSPDEYFPNGFDYTTDPNGENYVLEKTATPQFAKIMNGQGEFLELSQNRSNFIIYIEAKTPVTIQLKQFYFPGWSAYDAKSRDIDIINSSGNALITFNLPIGDHKITVKRDLLTIEKIGLFISLISFAILCFGAFVIKQNKSAKSNLKS